MCIYTVIKQKLKNSSRGVRDFTERPKIRCNRHKGTAKSNKDFGMYRI